MVGSSVVGRLTAVGRLMITLSVVGILIEQVGKMQKKNQNVRPVNRSFSHVMIYLKA